MADCLTRLEDWMEYEHPGWADRPIVAAVRRNLEEGLTASERTGGRSWEDRPATEA